MIIIYLPLLCGDLEKASFRHRSTNGVVRARSWSECRKLLTSLGPGIKLQLKRKKQVKQSFDVDMNMLRRNTHHRSSEGFKLKHGDECRKFHQRCCENVVAS